MNSLTVAEVEMLGKAWPKQVVESARRLLENLEDAAQVTDWPNPLEKHYSICGRQWCSFANGKKPQPWTDGRMAHPRFQSAQHIGQQANRSAHAYSRTDHQVSRYPQKIPALVETDGPDSARSFSCPAQHYQTKTWTAETLAAPRSTEKSVDYASEKGWLQPLLFLVVLGYNTGMGTHECCYLRVGRGGHAGERACYIQRRAPNSDFGWVSVPSSPSRSFLVASCGS